MSYQVLFWLALASSIAKSFYIAYLRAERRYLRMLVDATATTKEPR